MLTVSDTAYAIAHIRAVEALRPPGERLFDDPLAAVFDAAGAHAAEGTARFLSLPFFADGIRLRTRALDDVVRDALHAGTRQLVLVGAGFDTRARRLDEVRTTGTRAFEVDLAPVLDARHTLLSAAHAPDAPWDCAVPCDFSAPDLASTFVEALVAAGLRTDAPAVFVCEGVLAYLDRASIERTLAAVYRACAPGSRLAFDYGAYFFAEDSAEPVVRAAGFEGYDEVTYDVLWRRYLPGEPHENAWVCRLAVATRTA